MIQEKPVRRYSKTFAAIGRAKRADYRARVKARKAAAAAQGKG